jgi:thiamine kinase-like enzyme
LNIVYERIKDSACLNKDIIDNAIRDLKSCRDKVKVTENLARKISRLLSIENGIIKLEKDLMNMQTVGRIVGKDLIDKAYEAIRKLDETRAYELLNILQNRYREIVKVNEYLKEFLSLGDKEPFNCIRNDIEVISKKLVEGLGTGSIKIEDIRNTYFKIIENRPRINEIITNIEIAIKEIDINPAELQQHKEFILREFLNTVMTQGFDKSFNELVKLKDILNEIREKVKSLVNNISNIRAISSKLIQSKSFELISNTVLEFKTKYKELISKPLPFYIEENQKLLNKLKLFNEKTRDLYIEISNLKIFLDNLDEDVAEQVVKYLNDSMKISGSAEEVLNEFSTRIPSILDHKLKEFISKIDKDIKNFKERKKFLKSKFSKTLIDIILKKVLEDISTLRQEATTNLSEASKIINMLISRKRTYTLDEIISLLEENGLVIDKFILAKDTLEKVHEVSKLEGIENIISFNPKLVVNSLLITKNIEDGIRLAKLAYILAKKHDTSFVIDVLNPMKTSNVHEAALLLLTATGSSIFKDKEGYAAAHAMLLKIFEDYLADYVTCKDVADSAILSKSLKDLYDAFCIKNNLPQAIAIVALWCSEEDIRSSKALGLIGGYHVKKLKSYIEELSKILDTKFKDGELAAISYVVDNFWKNIPSMVHDELNSSIKFINESKILNLIRENGKYIRKESALEVLKIIRDIYEMIRDEDYYRGILQMYLDIEIMGELLAETKSELLLKIINNTGFPVEINEIKLNIKLNTYPVAEKTIKIEPYSYQDFKYILPKLYIDEYELVRGREINGNILISARIPGLRDNKFLTVGPKEITIPLKYHGPKGVLISYLEKLKKQITEIELPPTLRETIIGIGGNNVVLLGISKEDGRRVVVKVPGFVVDLGGMPTFGKVSECENYARRCKDATNRCGGKVARIRKIEFNPPYAVEEYIDGDTLRKKLNEVKRLNKEEALRIAINVGEALKCLHNSHVYHNDIRPENIIISKENVILIDVGIDEAWNLLRHILGRHIKGETQVGARVDEAYTHPLLLEKVKKENLTDEDKARLDLFQLGLLLYEMLLGYNPITILKAGHSKLLPAGLEELEKILIKVCSPNTLPELSLTEFIEELKKLLQF